MSAAGSPEPSPPAAAAEPSQPRARAPPPADLRQDLSMMEQKKRVTVILQSPSFREELESLIQEQTKKGNKWSNVWALRQIADFMASTSPAAFPTSPTGPSGVTPIDDLHGAEAAALAKGERLMRCKVGSVCRLLDLYGWAQLGDACVSLRLSKEQEHFLVSPKGLCCSEVTASSLVKVNMLGEVVEQGSTGFAVDAGAFSLHAAVYAARPAARCVVRLHTPAAAAVSAMRCGLLPVSHEALLAGEAAYLDFGGAPQDEAERLRLQKCLGPTCKVLVLRNHGVLALGDTVEEAFYKTFHLQAACEIQEKSKPKSDVLIPATVTAFVFDEEATAPALRPRARKQQKEKTRWLNTPNTYLRVDVADEQPGGPKTKTTWLKADELEKGSSGTAIRVENPNQFVPLYTDPQEVLEMRNKIREQNRQDVKSAGPQSQLLAGVIGEASRSPSTESQLAAAEAPGEPREEAPAEPEPPNPFSQLTDQELEEYKREVERKKLAPHGEKDAGEERRPASPLAEPPGGEGAGEEEEEEEGEQAPAEPPAEPAQGEERGAEEEGGKAGSREADGGKERVETAPSSPASPEGSPSKSPSKKKKKFRAPSFLKKGRKKEKAEA
ncbi:beta-adducin isoform X3 [Struthio camelus]|uniref:beta-adducin isoform X3 n=1 Tax=Struthio camelus TaxID=8801 RepID=UPI0036042EE5